MPSQNISPTPASSPSMVLCNYGVRIVSKTTPSRPVVEYHFGQAIIDKILKDTRRVHGYEWAIAEFNRIYPTSDQGQAESKGADSDSEDEVVNKTVICTVTILAAGVHRSVILDFNGAPIPQHIMGKLQQIQATPYHLFNFNSITATRNLIAALDPQLAKFFNGLKFFNPNAFDTKVAAFLRVAATPVYPNITLASSKPYMNAFFAAYGAHHNVSSVGRWASAFDLLMHIHGNHLRYAFIWVSRFTGKNTLKTLVDIGWLQSTEKQHGMFLLGPEAPAEFKRMLQLYYHKLFVIAQYYNKQKGIGYNVPGAMTVAELLKNGVYNVTRKKCRSDRKVHKPFGAETLQAYFKRLPSELDCDDGRDDTLDSSYNTMLKVVGVSSSPRSVMTSTPAASRTQQHCRLQARTPLHPASHAVELGSVVGDGVSLVRQF